MYPHGIRSSILLGNEGLFWRARADPPRLMVKLTSQPGEAGWLGILDWLRSGRPEVFDLVDHGFQLVPVKHTAGHNIG